MTERSAASSAVLELKDLSVVFPSGASEVKPVDGVSLSIGRGEAVALVGESGSGKSVTSLAIMRLLPSQARIGGQILWHDDSANVRNLAVLPLKAMRHLRGSKIAMIFQEPMTSLNPLQKVGRQIVEAIRLHKPTPRNDAWSQAEAALNLVGISDAARRLGNLPHEMSGGMRQRVMIAMALVCRPVLLIADEPTTALDVTVQAQILELIRRLQTTLGMSVLFITHDLGVVAEVADRMAVLYAGRIVETGAVRDVLARPLHPYTQGLLRSVPRVRQVKTRLATIPGMVPDLKRMPQGCRFMPRCTHAVAGLCDAAPPSLEDAGDGRAVRCFRWRELAEGSFVGA